MAMKVLTDPFVLNEAVERLQKLQPGAVRVWGKMSAAGMLCHLNDAYAGMIGARRASATGADRSTWAGRNVMRLFALHVPLQWPRGVPTVPEADQLIGGTQPKVFEEDRARVLASMQAFATMDFDGFGHPIFGRMTQWEWMRWAWLHADHHLRQFSA